ncbi:MAG: mucoidy inhibitor MuiA family protein [Verrucomicrobia bacterium]|nr:mucoidy inhibitor MuiA family protein [Verrucomicrobiota bacterium]
MIKDKDPALQKPLAAGAGSPWLSGPGIKALPLLRRFLSPGLPLTSSTGVLELVAGIRVKPSRLLLPVAIVLWRLAINPVTGVAATTEIPSRISDVTVFSDRAAVTRVAEADLPAGETTLAIVDLPDELIDDSLQVQAEGNAALTLLSNDLRREVLTGAANPRVRTLEEQVRNLEQQGAGLAFQIAQLKGRASYLATLTTAFAKGERTAPALPDVESIYRFYVDETAKLAAEQQNLERQAQALNVELERAKQELKTLNRSKAQRTLLVTLQAGQPAHARLRVQYQLRNASWKPVYDARTNDDENRVVLDYRGSVRQRTGEDWLGAALVLSTAQPGLSGRMPELQPVYLRFVEPPQPVVNSAPLGAPKARALAAVPAPGDSESAFQAQAEVVNRGLSVSYRAPLPANVPADGDPHAVALQQITLEGKPRYVTTPVLDQTAFLRYHVTNRTDALLLAGEVNLYRDGDLVGKGAINEVPSGAEFDLDFGRDQNLTVRRKRVVDRRSSSGLINRKDTQERRYQITLENHHPVAVAVQVIDALPVSQNTEITLTGISFSEPPTTQDQPTGKLTWEFDLPPQGKKTIEFGFTVQSPEGREIQEGF